jgi:hypothetical protein
MKRVSDNAQPGVDFWPYVERIPRSDFEGFDCSEGEVDNVYRHPAGVLEHVLIKSNDPNVFMVIVLNREAHSVVGHRLLNLATLYGLS